MTVDIRNPQGQALTTSDRSNAVAESLKQFARVARFVDRKKGVRSYQTHIKSDPWIPVLLVVVGLIPFLVGATYFGLIASDRYVTESRFAIRPALGGTTKSAADGKGDSDVGTSSSVPKELIAQDTLITANYILSRPMIEAMEKIMPLREMFSRDDIDWLSRFSPHKPVEKLLKYWKSRVNVEVETSGIMTLTVNTFDAKGSFDLTQSILKEAERVVNDLTSRMRDDALAESGRELVRAEERLDKVRVAMRDLRNRDGVLDASKTNETNLKMTAELRKARIELSVQLALSERDLAPESRRIQDLKLQIRDLDDNIRKIEHQAANQDPERRQVLADSLMQFESYNAEFEDALKYYAAVLAAHEKARIIAGRQVEFFTPIVAPVLAESPEQPRRILIISLLGAGCALLFALSVVVRKYTA